MCRFNPPRLGNRAAASARTAGSSGFAASRIALWNSARTPFSAVFRRFDTS
jgi:hypothetical protein